MTEQSQTDLGTPVPNWTPPRGPDMQPLQGRYCRLEALNAEAHAALLYRSYAGQDHVWDYLPYGPFSSSSQYHRWVREVAAQQDPQFWAIKNGSTGHWEGVASYLRITPDMGTIEVGHINYSPALQNSIAGTEAMYLLMQWAFEAGYRRYEWKCNALNMGSRRAAQRLGFSYEGTFRQAAVIKGYNRDTAWFAITDTDWPALKEAFDAWLRPGNFRADGSQIERLSDVTRLVRVSSDPLLSSNGRR